MKDPYAVLGLTQDAAPELIKQKYAELRALYGEQRFLAGEEGNEGARKLQELEEAWRKNVFRRSVRTDRFAHSLGQVQRSAGYARFRF